MFFQKNLRDNKSASPVIRTGSYNSKPVSMNETQNTTLIAYRFLFVHALDAIKNM